ALQATHAEWLGVNRRLTQLLYNPGRDLQERDKLLSELAARRDNLERELHQGMPKIDLARERSKYSPEDLAKELPAGAVFVDFLNYTRSEHDPKKPGAKGKKSTASYVAFVVARDRPIQRIELGAAQPIDEAIASWRKAIQNREESPAG